MRFDDALRRYGANEFTDDDIIRCTGLSDRKWRDLIRDKLVRTVTHVPGRGRVRLCDAATLKRAAMIAALNRAGSSLKVSSQIAYFAPFHTALYEVIEPRAILFDRSAVIDPETGLPSRLRQPLTDWFDPYQPAKAEPASDWMVQIFDGRFVGITYGPKQGSVIFGDLRDDGARFVGWLPLHQSDQFIGCAIEKLAKELGREKLAAAIVAWEDPNKWTRELGALGYLFEEHGDDDPLRAAAVTALQRALFTTTINVSLAIKQALRRYLAIERAETTALT
jgi:hypothetical protein